MTNDEIRQRCRKVYIHVTDNSIFGWAGREFEFVNAYREEKKAKDSLLVKGQANYQWDLGPEDKRSRVVGFYLVPIKKIE